MGKGQLLFNEYRKMTMLWKLSADEVIQLCKNVLNGTGYISNGQK